MRLHRVSAPVAVALSVLVAVVLAAVTALLLTSDSTGPPDTATLSSGYITTSKSTASVSTNIVKGMITINAGNYKYYPFNVPSGVFNIRVSGSFAANGGSGSDIRVYVLDNTNFINWQNGHDKNAFYDSGQATKGSISATLPSSGIYYLVFDNTFSTSYQENVNTQVGLVYSQTVTSMETATTTYFTS